MGGRLVRRVAGGRVYEADGEYVISSGGQWLTGVYRWRLSAVLALVAFRLWGWERHGGRQGLS